MEVKIEVKLRPPMMANYIDCESDAVSSKSGHCVSVSDLTREQAVEYGELMKVTFISHWANKQTKK